MRISDMLLAIANWLESPENEALLLAEDNDECLPVVAAYCVEAASLLKLAANEVDELEPAEESLITGESLAELAAIATEFDKSDDEQIRKQAAVIDELLLTIAANPEIVVNRKLAYQTRLENLKKKFEDNKDVLRDLNKISEVEKEIEKSPYYKEVNLLEEPLKTRYCPDHPGALIQRVSENEWQCSLDKKVYDFANGYTKLDGTKVPAGGVEYQTKVMQGDNYQSLFDTRQSRLGTNS